MRRPPVNRVVSQRLNAAGVERDGNHPIAAVVVDALDQELEQPALPARTERLPNRLELGQGQRLRFINQVASRRSTSSRTSVSRRSDSRDPLLNIRELEPPPSLEHRAPRAARSIPDAR